MYLEGLSKTVPPPKLHSVLLTTLIAQATATAPAQSLSEHTSNILSDICPSIKALEEKTRTEHGRARLHEYLDEHAVQDIIDFWEDEWIV